MSRCAAAVVGMVTLLAYLTAGTGVLPTPAALARLLGRASERVGLGEAHSYPCQGGQCACGSARECWTTCQCHTLAQKVAWARKHHVAIPDYVDLSGLETAVAKSASKPACPLCRTHELNETSDDTGDESAQTTTPTNGLPTLTALGCKGIQTLMAAGVVPVMALPSQLLFISTKHVYIRLPYDAGVMATRVLDVPEPPPRVA